MDLSRRAAVKAICGGALLGFLRATSHATESHVSATPKGALSVKDVGARMDGITDDTAAVATALTTADTVFVPVGFCVIENLSIPDGKALIGAGRGSVLRLPVGSTGRLIVVSGGRDLAVRDLTIDGGGTGTSLALFTDCQRVSLKRLCVTGSAGHGIELDGCRHCELQDLTIFETGTLSSHAALYLKDPTGTGLQNRVTGVSFNRLNGRGLHVLGNDGTQIANLVGKMRNGEIILFENSALCIAKNIEWEGPGLHTESRSDGIAFNGNCFHNVLSDFLGELSSGHAVSINGQDGRYGASYNTVSDGKIVAPNEGGVVITDQGVKGSIPTGNVVSNVIVEDAGRERPSPAFSAWGATDNRFENCTARETQRWPTTTYGFEDGGAVNGSAHNTFKGRLIGAFSKGKYVLGHALSSVEESPAD